LGNVRLFRHCSMALGVHLAVHQAKSTREAERHLPAIRKAPRARHRRDVPIATTLQRRQVVLFAKTPKNVALEAWAVVTWAAAKRTKAKLEVQGHGNQGIAHAEPLVVSSIIVSVHAHLGKHAWPAAAAVHTAPHIFSTITGVSNPLGIRRSGLISDCSVPVWMEGWLLDRRAYRGLKMDRSSIYRLHKSFSANMMRCLRIDVSWLLWDRLHVDNSCLPCRALHRYGVRYALGYRRVRTLLHCNGFR